MVVCPNGSSPQAGQDAYFWLGYDSLKNYLSTQAVKVEPLIFAPLPTLITTADFCSVDPPDTPTISESEVINAFLDPLSALPSLLAKLNQGARAYEWAARCQCNAITSGCWCVDYTQMGLVLSSGNFGTAYTIAHNMTVEADGTLDQIGFYRSGLTNSGQSRNWWLHDADTGTLLASGTFAADAGTGLQVVSISVPVTAGQHIQVSYYQPSGQTEAYYSNNNPITGSCLQGGTRYSTTGSSSSLITTNPTSAFWPPISIHLDLSTSPYTVDPPTPPSWPDVPDYPVTTGCTTDDVCALVQQLQTNLSLVNQMVTLIQRQAAPFGYIPKGDPYVVSGEGTLTVADILGLSVSVSGLSQYSVRDANPDVYYNVGSVALGTADGYGEEIPISHTSQLILPVSGAITRIAYRFNTGVTATIQLLQKEA